MSQFSRFNQVIDDMVQSTLYLYKKREHDEWSTLEKQPSGFVRIQDKAGPMVSGTVFIRHYLHFESLSDCQLGESQKLEHTFAIVLKTQTCCKNQETIETFPVSDSFRVMACMGLR